MMKKIGKRSLGVPNNSAIPLIARQDWPKSGQPAASTHLGDCEHSPKPSNHSNLGDSDEVSSGSRSHLVKRIDAEEKTAGGIIIPDTAKEKPSQGEVIAVGPGGRDEAGKLIPIDLKVGDKVLLGKWSGTEVKIDGQDLLIMKESDILGVLEARSRRRRRPRAPALPNSAGPGPAMTPRVSNFQFGDNQICQPKKSNLASTRAIKCCAVSRFSPTR